MLCEEQFEQLRMQNRGCATVLDWAEEVDRGGVPPSRLFESMSWVRGCVLLTASLGEIRTRECG